MPAFSTRDLSSESIDQSGKIKHLPPSDENRKRPKFKRVQPKKVKRGR